jgi:RND family efflux transporter MFP subunit
MKSRTTTAVRAHVGCLLAIFAVACGNGSSETDSSQLAPPLNVAVTTTSSASIAEPLEAGGVVAADLSATLTSRLVAAVMDVRSRAGDRVRKGDVLVVLDDRDVTARAREAQASVNAAEQGLAGVTSDHAAAAAEQKLAVAFHARIAALHARRSATTQELDEAEAGMLSATAREAGARARIQQAADQLAAARAAADAAAATQSFGVVRAPFDGMVTERMIDPGNLASPGTPLLRIESVGAPRIDVRVDEARERYVRVGDQVEVLFESRDGAPPVPEVVAGVVAEVARISADERAFTVKIALPGGRAPRTGTFARVRFRGPSRQALIIPTTAVRLQGQLASAFTVENGVARLRLLRTGYRDTEGVEVLAGLEAGEVIISAPPPELVDGRRVTARDSTDVGAKR